MSIGRADIRPDIGTTIVTIESLKFSPPCESMVDPNARHTSLNNYKQCGNAAKWATYWSKECTHSSILLMCDQHKQRLMNPALIKANETFACSSCTLENTYSPCYLLRIEPL